MQERLPNGNVENYAIEIKVESAIGTNGGSFMQGIQADITKLRTFPAQNGRWVIGVGYSVPAKQAMQAFADVGGIVRLHFIAMKLGKTPSKLPRE